jgi:hypothetical protein
MDVWQACGCNELVAACVGRAKLRRQRLVAASDSGTNKHRIACSAA